MEQETGRAESAPSFRFCVPPSASRSLPAVQKHPQANEKATERAPGNKAVDVFGG